MMKIKTASAKGAYELVSGLEIHVQLNTQSKIFSSDSAKFGADSNRHISAVSMALPGTLPKLNKETVAKAIRIGLALNCEINQHSFFDRKNYFYADLPKGYQITQNNSPICKNGFIQITLPNGEEKRIGINRIHLEEDAGKSMHDQNPAYSYIDLNRAGVPLIEIVTEPDMRSAEEASALLAEIRQLVRHLKVSDGNMEEGSLRCDANVSIRKKGDAALGMRCEVKNLNSVKNVRRAIDFEFNRQVEVIENGGQIVQRSLNFDADLGVASPMRNKEEADDYRYFPDPDLQPLYISDDWLAEIKSAMPVLPQDIARQLITEQGLSRAEAGVFAEDFSLYQYYLRAKPQVENIKSLVNWLLGPIKAILNDKNINIEQFEVSPPQLASVINLVDKKKISQQTALRQLLPNLKPDTLDAGALAERLNLLINENNDVLDDFIEKVLQKYQPQVEAYKKGKKGVLGLFVGEVMKLSGGKANAEKINEIFIERLKK